MASDERESRTGHGEVVPLVHKVEVPPKRNVFQEIGSELWELFFHDAPVDQFKGQTKMKKGILSLKFIFPILDWIPKYNYKMLIADIISGCTIASLAIPQVGQNHHFRFGISLLPASTNLNSHLIVSLVVVDAIVGSRLCEVGWSSTCKRLV